MIQNAIGLRGRTPFVGRRSLAWIISLFVVFVGSSGSAQSDAVALDPGRFSVDFENEDIRAVRTILDAGDQTKVVLGTRGYNVWLTDAEIEVQVQGGPTLQFTYRKGETNWLPSDWMLSIVNRGENQIEWMHIEPKTKPDPVAVKPRALRHQLVKPTDIKAGETYPMVVFLHGYGERGTDNNKQMTQGVPELLEYAASSNTPMFLLAPQHDAEPWHTAAVLEDKPFSFDPTPTRPIAHTIDLIKETLSAQPIDRKRIYVTGLSMGAFGVWDLIAREPDLFAAAVPVAGGLASDAPEPVKDVPVWIMHGSADTTVHPNHSRRAFHAMGGHDGAARMTEFPTLAHDSRAWEGMFGNAEMLDWLFSQSRDEGS